MSTTPDYVILFSARSIVSLVGILCICGGNWLADRVWDEQAAVPTADADGDYRGMEQGAGTDMPSLDRLQSVQGISYTAIAGWLLLAASFCLTRSDWFGMQTDLFVWLGVILIVMIGLIQTVAVRKAMQERSMHQQRFFFLVTLGLGFVVEAAIADIIEPNAPVWMAPFGAICVAVAPVLMWRTRKMGYTYELEGKPNAQPIVYNFGGPLAVLGWFWFWIGLNVVAATPTAWYLPVYMTSRTAVAYIGAVLVVVATWMAGYALDESEDGMVNGLSRDSAGFGVGGVFFGTVSEVGPAIAITWFILGIAAFLPYFAGVVPILLFLALVGQGVVLAIVHQIACRSGVPSGRPEILTRWSQYSYLGFAVIVMLLMFSSGTSILSWNTLVRLVSSVVGVVFYSWGQYVLHQDRKRGKHWMETDQKNPNPIVFSHGIPMFSLGALLLAYSMTIP